MKLTNLNHQRKGFTILELLIAMGVFSFVLLLVTVVIIGIGNLYTKGINLSRTQDAVRNIVGDISQNLSYTSSNPITAISGDVNAICIGDVRYTYVLKKRIGDNPYVHIFWKDKLSTNGSCPVADLKIPDPSDSTGGVVGSGTELIPGNTSLQSFSVTPTSSPYTINVTLAYGDPNSLISGKCPSNSANQYCAVSSLQTTAVKRL
jgi:prepilin-type N-terminal cleavage/methylation domain-containing protein